MRKREMSSPEPEQTDSSLEADSSLEDNKERIEKSARFVLRAASDRDSLARQREKRGWLSRGHETLKAEHPGYDYVSKLDNGDVISRIGDPNTGFYSDIDNPYTLDMTISQPNGVPKESILANMHDEGDTLVVSNMLHIRQHTGDQVRTSIEDDSGSVSIGEDGKVSASDHPLTIDKLVPEKWETRLDPETGEEVKIPIGSVVAHTTVLHGPKAERARQIILNRTGDILGEEQRAVDKLANSHYGEAGDVAA